MRVGTWVQNSRKKDRGTNAKLGSDGPGRTSALLLHETENNAVVKARGHFLCWCLPVSQRLPSKLLTCQKLHDRAAAPAAPRTRDGSFFCSPEERSSRATTP